MVFSGAFAGAPSPFGGGFAPAGITPLPGPAVTGARTHYAFDSDGSGGPVRVIVIDNSRGSLAASDPHQNPPEAQLPWLQRDPRRCARPRDPGDRRRQPRPQLALPTVAERRHRRGRDRAGAGRRRRLGVLLRAPGGEPRLSDPERCENDHSRVRDGHARVPLTARQHQRRAGRRLRRRGPAAGRGRHRQARPADQPRAGRRPAAAGRVRAHATGRRRHAPAPLAAVAVPGPRAPAGRWRPLGPVRRRCRPAAARL